MSAIPTTDHRDRRISQAQDGESPGGISPILAINDLHKSFGNFHALHGVTFSIMPGERLALLGPNGAGKTTLIRCLSGRTRFDSGEIHLNGDLIASAGARDSIGLVPQEIAVYEDLSTKENLVTFGSLHGLRGASLRERVDWALQWTGLKDRAKDLVGGFSGGMQRRVNLACGVLHSPAVLLLDEPTVGVDPQSREKIFMMLDDLNRDGTSILLTTHHLDEAEERSDRIVIMDRGLVVADGTIEELIDRSVGRSRLVRLRINRSSGAGIPPGTRDDGMNKKRCRTDRIETRLENVSHALPELMSQLNREGIEILDLEVHAPSLHDVFLHLTGKELRD